MNFSSIDSSGLQERLPFATIWPRDAIYGFCP